MPSRVSSPASARARDPFFLPPFGVCGGMQACLTAVSQSQVDRELEERTRTSRICLLLDVFGESVWRKEDGAAAISRDVIEAVLVKKVMK